MVVFVRVYALSESQERFPATPTIAFGRASRQKSYHTRITQISPQKSLQARSRNHSNRTRTNRGLVTCHRFLDVSSLPRASDFLARLVTYVYLSTLASVGLVRASRNVRKSLKSRTCHSTPMSPRLFTPASVGLLSASRNVR